MSCKHAWPKLNSGCLKVESPNWSRIFRLILMAPTGHHTITKHTIAPIHLIITPVLSTIIPGPMLVSMAIILQIRMKRTIHTMVAQKQHILMLMGIQPSKTLGVNTCSALAGTPCPALDISLQILKWQQMRSKLSLDRHYLLMWMIYKLSPFIFPAEAGGRPLASNLCTLPPHSPQDKPEKTFGIEEKLECDFVKYSNPGEKDQDESRLGLTTSSSAGGEKDKELGHHINSGDSSFHRLRQNPKHTHETGTGRASFQVSSDTNAERDKSRKGSPNGNTEPPGNPKDIGPGFTRGYSRGYSQSSLSIASLNVKNLKINLNFVVSLSKSHNIIILQEHWLYGFESSLAQQIYNNSNFHIKCVDDLDPIPPVQPPRGTLEHVFYGKMT